MRTCPQWAKPTVLLCHCATVVVCASCILETNIDSRRPGVPSAAVGEDVRAAARVQYWHRLSMDGARIWHAAADGEGQSQERPNTDMEPPRHHQARDWLHARVRLEPDLLSHSPSWIQGVFDHAWAPMTAMAHQLRSLPPDLWGPLLSWDSGFVFICTRASDYLPGPATIRHRAVVNVAYVSVEDLASDNEQPLHVLGHLIDHHLGSGGDPQGTWLSDGGGLVPRWREAGQRLPRLYALGYAVDDIARTNVQDYFAQSLALYCRDRQRLNVADPQIDKWFSNTLWNEAFWRTAAQENEKERKLT